MKPVADNGDQGHGRGDEHKSSGPAEQLHLVRGKGAYLDDLEPLGTLHMAFVRSPHARARIVSVETAEAAAHPGVERVLTASDIAGGIRPMRTRLDPHGAYDYQVTDWYPLARDQVRYVGEAVAVVVADSRYRAEDAAALIEVEYEPESAVAGAEAALAPNAPRVHAELDDNILFRVRAGESYANTALDDPSLTRVSGRFRHPRVTGLAIENCGVLAEYRPQSRELVVHSSTQIPHLLRDILSECLGLPASNLRVIAPDVGGAFGIKMQAFPEELIAALVAYRAGRPIKWIQDRMENLQASMHARDIVVEADLAATSDGMLAGMRARAVCDVGAYSSFPLSCGLEPHTVGSALPGPYRLPFFAYEGVAVATNKCPQGAYRGVGFTLGPLVMEGLMDRLARRLDMDPVDLRQRNLITSGEFPYQSLSGAVYDSGDYPALLQQALEQADYTRWRAEQKKPHNGERTLGVGIACFVEATGMNRNVYRARGMVHVPGFDAASLRVNPDGQVAAAVSTPSQGQTQATAFTRLLQATLGLPEWSIHINLGDTGRTPYGSGTFASRSMVSGGGALLRAAGKMQNKLVRLAAVYWDIEAAQVQYRQGGVERADAPGQRLTLSDLAAIAYSAKQPLPADWEPGLEVQCVYDPPATAVSAAVHLALVEVDNATGRVQLRRYVVAEDCGPMVNPQAVAGQVYGGVAQGVGTALFEEIVYDAEGQLLTATLMDYLIPGTCEAPTVQISHRQTPSSHNEGGLKGVGESGIIGAPAAIANAVIDAIGRSPAQLDLPLTPERIVRLIHGGELA